MGWWKDAMGPGPRRGALVIPVVVVVVAAAVTFRLVAAAAGTEAVRSAGMSGVLVDVLNVGVLWLVVPSVGAYLCARRAPLAAVLGAALAWLMTGVYYGTAVPDAPHEVVWMLGGAVVAAGYSSLLAATRMAPWMVAAPFVLELPAVTALAAARGHAPGGTVVVVGLVEAALGLLLMVALTVRRRDRATRRD